jgi:hypothetical protein
MQTIICSFFTLLLILGLAGAVHAGGDKDFFDRTFSTDRGP